MKFQKQKFRHKPEEGIFGDCWRTAIACILGLDRDSVPHFNEAGENGDGDARTKEWLISKGYVMYNLAYEIPTLERMLEVMTTQHYGGPIYLLSGTSRNGTSHVVVCEGGEIVHDPAIDNSGIVGPCSDGHFWINVIARREPWL